MKNRYIISLMTLAGLNPEQLECVRQHDGSMLLIAGAGTGKTKTITTRIADMILSGIEPKKIVALTFTNKAAREMGERLVSMAGKTAGTKVNTGTFHSFCLKWLRQSSGFLGLSRQFVILNPSDQTDIAGKIFAEMGSSSKDMPVDVLIQIIGDIKNNFCFSEEGFRNKFSQFSKINQAYIEGSVEHVWNLFCQYERYLRVNDAIDFDDCMYKLLYLFENTESVHLDLSSRFDYFIVDEFQDTNLLQLEVLKYLCSKKKNICVVGDDDQSIYSWRGAHSGIFSEYESIFEGSRTIKLEQNYRCSKIILDAANAVIEKNSGRKEKKLWSQSQVQHRIGLTEYDDEEHQAQEVGLKILGFLGKGVPESDLAILYRTNQQSTAIELSLKELGIRYKVYGGSSIFERKEIKDALSYLELVANRNAKIPFWRIINTPPRGLGLKSLERLSETAKEESKGPMAILNGDLSFLSSGAAEGSRIFHDKIRSMSQSDYSTPEALGKLVSKIITEFELDRYVAKTVSDEKARQKKLSNLKSLPGWLEKNFERCLKYNPEENVAGFLDRLFLRDKDFGNAEESKHQVSVMSIHSAKGLEFSKVFLIGLNDGILPHKNSLSGDLRSLEEERRLFYVALTRAKTEIFMSFVKKSFFRKEHVYLKESRFLKEVPEELLERQTKSSDVPEEKRKARTLGKLRQIRSEMR